MASPRFDPAEQGSPGWLKARQGCLTASRMSDALDFNKKGEEGAKRRDLKNHLCAERLTDSSVNNYVSPAMKHGTYWEPVARAAYEAKTGELVNPCGFALHGGIEYFGASPDGLVGKDGLIEIKCPTITTFTKWLHAKVMPPDYIPQMLAQLAVTRRKWCDFVAFFPSTGDVEEIADPYELDCFGKITVPESHRIKVWRFEPEPERISQIEDAAITFLNEVDQMFEQVIMSCE